MFKRLISSLICLTFSFSNLQYAHAQEFSINQLPVPGTMVGESAPFSPLALKGIVVNPQKPLEFQFIVDTGNSDVISTSTVIPAKAGILNQEQLKIESTRLIKYFLAGLTIPEGDLWVNLSPYEKNRMVPEALGQTELGRDLLAQDYILKQLTASLIYPEKDLGKKFWSRVYAKAQQQFGTTNVLVNTFNKVWILPDQAQVFENKNAAYVTKATLKVMLDEDYLALNKHQGQPGDMFMSELQRTCPQAGCQASKPLNVKAPQGNNGTHSIASQIISQIIIPEITKEVNTGKNFAPLRQIYQALILAKWYKETIQNALLDALYTNKNKLSGVNLKDPTIKEQIYERYLKAYKRGAFNYIKEDPTPEGQVMPRKYFSGGTYFGNYQVATDGSQAMISAGVRGALLALTISLSAQNNTPYQISSLQPKQNTMINQMPLLVSMEAVQEAKVMKPDKAMLDSLAANSTLIIIGLGTALAFLFKFRMNRRLKLVEVLRNPDQTFVFNYIKNKAGRYPYWLLSDVKNFIIDIKNDPFYQNPIGERYLSEMWGIPTYFDPRLNAGLVKAMAEFCQTRDEVIETMDFILELDSQHKDDFMQTAIVWARNRSLTRMAIENSQKPRISKQTLSMTLRERLSVFKGDKDKKDAAMETGVNEKLLALEHHVNNGGVLSLNDIIALGKMRNAVQRELRSNKSLSNARIAQLNGYLERINKLIRGTTLPPTITKTAAAEQVRIVQEDELGALTGIWQAVNLITAFYAPSIKSDYGLFVQRYKHGYALKLSRFVQKKPIIIFITNTEAGAKKVNAILRNQATELREGLEGILLTTEGDADSREAKAGEFLVEAIKKIVIAAKIRPSQVSSTSSASPAMSTYISVQNGLFKGLPDAKVPPKQDTAMQAPDADRITNEVMEQLGKLMVFSKDALTAAVSDILPESPNMIGPKEIAQVTPEKISSTSEANFSIVLSPDVTKRYAPKNITGYANRLLKIAYGQIPIPSDFFYIKIDMNHEYFCMEKNPVILKIDRQAHRPLTEEQMFGDIKRGLLAGATGNSNGLISAIAVLMMDKESLRKLLKMFNTDGDALKDIEQMKKMAELTVKNYVRLGKEVWLENLVVFIILVDSQRLDHFNLWPIAKTKGQISQEILGILSSLIKYSEYRIRVDSRIMNLEPETWRIIKALEKYKSFSTENFSENLNRALNAANSNAAMILNDKLSKASVAENGGIDLNQIKVKRNGKTVNVQFDPAQLNALEQGGFEGFTPVITGFQYIKSPFPLLGINTTNQPETLAKV